MTRTYVEFDPPEGWRPPEMNGQSMRFDQVCTFEALPSGKICMVKFGDVDMPTQSGDRSEKKPDYREYSQGIIDAAEQQGGYSQQQ